MARFRSWRAFRHRLAVAGTFFAYLIATLGLPLPAAVHKEVSEPFPCQDHPCGCQSAEQCWQHCCRFTPEERLAWARAHNVQPPEYAEKPPKKPSEQGWNTVKQRDRDQKAPSAKSCCRAKAEHATCCRTTEGRSVKTSPRSGRFRWAISMHVRTCQGYSTLWINAGAVLPIPPRAAWIPDCVPSARTARLSIFICPSEARPNNFTLVGPGGNPLPDANGQAITLAYGSYVGMSGAPNGVTSDAYDNNGAFLRNRSMRMTEITDGLSHTLFVGERCTNMSDTTWVGAVTGAVVPDLRYPDQPDQLANAEGDAALVLAHGSTTHLPNNPLVKDADATASFHVLGVNFLYGDGSVRSIGTGIDPHLYQALCTRNGGEPTGGDY